MATAIKMSISGDIEKAGVQVSTDHPSNSHHHLHGYGTRARETIRHFLHPDGRRIHVASSPDHAHKLRKSLAQIHEQDQFDIFVSGSPEHLDALRKAQTYQESRREHLRNSHADFYDQFYSVHNELDTLANELKRVTTQGVSLEAHFSKFGYNAHIKSYDDEDETPPHSGASTPKAPSLSSGKSGSIERGSAVPLKLFKTPVVRQYFHKGILWRASGNEEVQSFELFVDLLYVGIIAINGDATAQNATGKSLLHFVITFTLSWKIWNDMALIISWFETDDIFQRLCIIFLLTCLFGYTTNITQAFETTYATLIAFYLTARLFMATYLALVAYMIPMIRGAMAFHLLTVLCGAALWIGSIHVDYPSQLALIWPALFMDICAPVFSVLWTNLASRVLGPRLSALYEKYYSFQPAVNIEHRTERTNAFVTLVFGYTVVAILYQSTVNGIDAFFGKAVLGLIQAFCFNWIYFEIDGANIHTHAIRRHKVSALAWSMVHLPFIMSFVLAGGALSRLVAAHDTPDSNVEHITEMYHERSKGQIEAGIRWFYCAGLGIALACMGGISLSHTHKEIEGLRLRKPFRLALRYAIAATITCLALAESLDSTELLATVTCLIVLTLVAELWFGSSCHNNMWQRCQPCRYVGSCGKRKIEALVKDGNEVDVSNLAEEKGGTTGGATVAPL